MQKPKSASKKSSRKDDEFDPDFEVLISSRNYHRMVYLFEFPKTARKSHEYKYLVQVILQNYPQYKQVKEDTFNNSLDIAILRYIHERCIRIKKGKIIIISDGKRVIENKGWKPMPPLSDTFPREHIINNFVGIMAGDYGYNNIKSTLFDKKGSTPPLIISFKDEDEELDEDEE